MSGKMIGGNHLACNHLVPKTRKQAKAWTPNGKDLQVGWLSKQLGIRIAADVFPAVEFPRDDHAVPACPKSVFGQTLNRTQTKPTP